MTGKRSKCHLHIPLLFEKGVPVGYHVHLRPEKDRRYWSFRFWPDLALDTPELNLAFDGSVDGSKEEFDAKWLDIFRELEKEGQMSEQGVCDSGALWCSGHHLTQEAILRLLAELYVPYWQKVIRMVQACAPGESLRKASVEMFLEFLEKDNEQKKTVQREKIQ